MPPKQVIFIALADDAVAFRTVLSDYLAKQGCSVMSQAGDGKELFEQLETLEILPQICVLDSQMPVMNGYDTAKTLRLYYPHIRILGYSFFNEYTRRKMFECGADECLDKEAPPEKLLEAIMMLYQLERS